MNYSVRLNLLKLEGAGVMKIQGKTATKNCVVIPIDSNGIYLSVDDKMKAKSAYLDLNVWENREPSKFGDTHAIKVSLPKEMREAMSDEDLSKMQYVGNMKPMLKQSQDEIQKSIDAPTQKAEDYDDLPF